MVEAFPYDTAPRYLLRGRAPGRWSPPPLPARCLSTDEPRALHSSP
jgi:hypothetical protein